MKTIPHWCIFPLFLLAFGMIIGVELGAMPMPVEKRMANSSYVMAGISILFLGFSIFDIFYKTEQRPHIVLPLLGYAAGAALFGRWEWNMGQAWKLPRQERLALDMTTLPLFGFACILAASAGMYVIARKFAMARERLRRSG